MEETNKIEEILKKQEQILNFVQLQNSTQEFINRDVVCAYLNYKPGQLNKFLKSSGIRYTKVGRRVLVDSKSLNEYLNANAKA